MRAPYHNLDDFEDEAGWDHMDQMPGMSKELLALIMQDLLDKENGSIAPDTTGADYFFLKEFITREMELDFAAIEQDFLKHCSDRLKEFDDVDWYGEEEHWNYEPEFALKKKILRLIYNGAKISDLYCVELIKYLYKLYHKKEYNQLKRFRVITASEIFSLSEDEFGGNSCETMGRILGMCVFMDIQLDESCSFLYLYLEKIRKEEIQEAEEQRKFLTFEDGLFEECIHQVEMWTERGNNKDVRQFRKNHEEYWRGEEFVGNCLRHHGYREDYAYFCRTNNMGLSIQMARTLAILRTMDPKREYSYEEVQRYTVIYSTVAALTDVADSFYVQMGYLTGDSIDEFEKEEILFRPENIIIRQPSEKKQKAQKPIMNVAPVSTGKASEEDYLKEIAALRKKIHEQEQENKELRERYHQIKLAQAEDGKLIQKYQSEREELIALREYAYRSELEPSQITEDSFADMKKAIADKNIAIIGGHINWINKLKQLFPQWLFIHSESYKTIDGKMLEGKDKVYFFTDHISHATYGKFITAVRERKIPFGYLGTLNIEQIVRQVYEDMNSSGDK